MTLAARPIRVASIPSCHPYVRHVAPAGVTVMPDPVPSDATQGRWWPPVMCDAAWVTAHHDLFDLMHLHFGTESYTTEHIRSFVHALRISRRPLVYTVHDLENPQLTDQTLHREHLDVLIPAADEVVTLTAGAAAMIKSRWGRTAQVIPHPHVLASTADAPCGERSDAFVVGMHLRDIRPGTDAVLAVSTLLDAVDRLRGQDVAAIARVHVNEGVRDEAARDQVAALVSAHPAAVLRRSERLDDAALAQSVAALDVAVLPYCTGTHSGWVELCWDLGVPVAGARVGYADEQHPHDFFGFDAGDGDALATGVRGLLAGASRPGSAARMMRIAQRRRQRAAEASAITAAHIALYTRALTAAGQAA